MTATREVTVTKKRKTLSPSFREEPIDNPKVISLEIRRIYGANRQVKPKYSKTVELIVLVEDGMGDLPDNINIVQEHGNHVVTCNEQNYCGRVLRISAIGQAIHDWVKKVSNVWVTNVFPCEEWSMVKAA